MKKKTAKKSPKKKAARKLTLRRRVPAERPPKVGGRERSTDLKDMWSRVGRRPMLESVALADLSGEIKRIREAQGVSIAQLAKKVEAAPATLIKFEDRGAGIPLKLLLTVCAALGSELKVVSASKSK